MIERSGLRLITIELILTLLLYFIYLPLSISMLIISLFTIYFFRDPPREIQEGVVSPADGRIDFINENRIEIFMSPFDCHVNRSPVDGVVEKINYRKGAFIPAYRRNDFNERNEIIISTPYGKFKVEQIAGFFARRIVCYVEEGQKIQKGEKIGMIRFGSRVTLDIPKDFKIIRRKWEKIKAGETVAIKEIKEIATEKRDG